LSAKPSGTPTGWQHLIDRSWLEGSAATLVRDRYLSARSFEAKTAPVEKHKAFSALKE